MLDAFMPTGPFKDEFQHDLGYQHMLPQHVAPKQRRPEVGERRYLQHTLTDQYQLRHKPIEDYQYFAALVVLEDGSVHLRSSRDLKPYKGVILEDAVMKFSHIMSDFVGAPGMTPDSAPYAPAEQLNRIL